MTNALFISRSTLLADLLKREKHPIDKDNAALNELRQQRRCMAKDIRQQLGLSTTQVKQPDADRPINPRSPGFQNSKHKTPYQWLATRFTSYRYAMAQNLRKSNQIIAHRKEIEPGIGLRMNSIITGVALDPAKSSALVLNTHA